MDIVKGKVTWVDIQNPVKADIDYLKTIHDFHPIILDELLHLSARSKVEHWDSYLYLTYHFPVYDPKMRTSRPAEIDFLITQNTVITIHYEPLEPIQNFSRYLEQNAHMKQQILQNGGYAVYYLLREVNDFCLRQLRHVEHNVMSVTKDLFSHQEYKMLQRISYIKRDILDYGIIIKPEAAILQSLREVGVKFWGEGLRIYLSDLMGDHGKIVDELISFRETIESSEETNGQLLSAKTNSVMQRFTILAFLTFPLALYTSTFGIDIVTKEINNPIYFWLGFATVLIVTLVAVYIFKKRGFWQD